MAPQRPQGLLPTSPWAARRRLWAQARQPYRLTLVRMGITWMALGGWAFALTPPLLDWARSPDSSEGESYAEQELSFREETNLRVGILKDYDISERAGGAQRAMQLFERNAPGGVELVRISATSDVLDPSCDAFVTGLVKGFPDHLLQQLVTGDKPYVQYQFDLWDDAPNAYNWAAALTKNAKVSLFPSPMYRAMFLRGWSIDGEEKHICLPPPFDMNDITPHRLEADKKPREGLCYFGEVHPLKGIDIIIRWAENLGQTVDFYGPLSYNFPPSRAFNYLGVPPQDILYQEVAKHEWLIHMPRKADGFSYSLLEAMCLGLKVYASGKLGIESWLEICTQGGFEELVEKCCLAPGAFWELFMNSVS